MKRWDLREAVAMPDWVPVWFWLRFVRGDMQPLPQQGINPEAMSMAQYDELQAEWWRSGSPSPTAEQIVMAVSANPLIDGIPF